jgi:hypothetical protein
MSLTREMAKRRVVQFKIKDSPSPKQKRKLTHHRHMTTGSGG